MIALSCVAVCAACVSVPRQTETMKRAGVEDLTATQLRELLLQYAAEYTRAVEHAADSMTVETTDPTIRRRFLLWKLVSARGVREAALVSEPLLGLIDVWLFAIQARMYLEAPPPYLPVLSQEQLDAARAVVYRQEARARELAISVTTLDRVTRFEPRLLEFAAAHPIDPLTMERTSIIAADSAMLRDVGGGLGATMAATYWSMREIDDRLSALDATLGKELRWNINLLAYDLAELPVVDTALTGILRSLERITALTDTLPTLVSAERAAVLDALHAELAALTGAIDDMRRETLDAVSAERMAVLQAVTQERLALLEAVSRERMATLTTVDSLLSRTMDRSERLVDHIIWRMVQVGMVAFALVFAALLLALRLRRPARPS
jgi:hypothetical protein